MQDFTLEIRGERPNPLLVILKGDISEKDVKPDLRCEQAEITYRYAENAPGCASMAVSTATSSYRGRWTYKHANEPEQRLHRFIQNVGHFIFKVLRRDWHTVLCE